MDKGTTRLYMEDSSKSGRTFRCQNEDFVYTFGDQPILLFFFFFRASSEVVQARSEYNLTSTRII